ncbi:SusC/RagA family TonB-linked outer membrane protein [Sphingobacterium haloxyli]|uniref:SusC/RagA family TonB-linked outer membrane protein n=1 Tax=Sphingobacterium haloxyli TaxID=2100533 RepID=UPI001FAFD87B|nr:SusC/RagA family TonB-linked outer membrane protein [Sphingobacterium haloxyli]
MKLTVVIFFASMMLSFANAHGQRVNLNHQKAQLKKVLVDISKQSGYTFIYDEKELTSTYPVSIVIENGTIQETLDVLFGDQPLTYEVKGKSIAITRLSQVTSTRSGESPGIQQYTIKGRVTDGKGEPLAGVTVALKGASIATSTGMDGAYGIEVPAQQGVLVFDYMGFARQEVSINGKSVVNIVLKEQLSDLDEVVVVGYGTQRKSDLTGAVASVAEKDFNKGPLISADQLIQGKVSGVQMVNNSGQPGGASTVRIRGNSAVTGSGQPLYVVDGVALDGRTSRPNQSGGIGTSPAGNPLSFINPTDIASIQVLKDASATAIYGSRAAYGVVLITTKRGQEGAVKVDVNSSGGVANIMRNIDILDGNQYRDALNKYGFTTGDYGDNVDALGTILRTAYNQNHNLSLSGGNADNKYRASFGYQDQQGIVQKTGFKRYSGAFNGNFKMLESKKLGLDVNLLASQNREDIAPVVTDAGANGSLIGQALAWNPTRPLRNADGSLAIEQGNIINPLAMSEAYDDRANVTNILASLSPFYKFNDWLEYRMLLSVNYSKGERRSSTRSFINIQGIQADPENDFAGGYASVANNELVTKQLTHTLSFNKEVAADLNLNAVIGYEYMDFINRGTDMNARGFGDIPVDYTDIMQATAPGNRNINSFHDPTTQLQSYFGRATFNLKERYLLTATVRVDGSTKFGENNRYGTFPSFAAAWNIKNEGFMTDMTWLNELKIRAGWGKTGNQEFPSGSSQRRYSIGFGSGEQTRPINNNENTDLRWQSDEQINIGADFGFFEGRLQGTVDFFHKKTTDLLFPQTPQYPASPDASITWINLPGEVINKGVELNLNGVIIENDDFRWDLGGNATFVKNRVQNLGESEIIRTGSLSGQGLSDVTVQVVQNGYPLFAFVTREYLGLDEEGFSRFTDEGFVFHRVGNPNPRVLLGVSTGIDYKRFSFSANFNGVIGQDIYNNTANAVLPISNLGSRNIASELMSQGVLESPANPIAASSRYIENGSYLKLANATLNYRIGDVGASIKNLGVFLNGQNIFVVTKYKGFDPEVNVNKSVNSVPSAGIDNVTYPTARTFNIGVNFSL